jgi:hypothetical protein
MKIKEKVKIKIMQIPEGIVFTYEDISQNPDEKETVIKSINRFVASGDLSKLAKGRFYRAKTTQFGKLQPNEFETSKDLLEKKGKLIGYLTGFAIYNKLKLTTQIGNIIQIGRRDPKPSIQRGRYKIQFVKQNNEITKQNIPILQILDSIRYIKQIPDSSPFFICNRLKAIISELSSKERVLLVELALNYSPATRALTGALLDEVSSANLTDELLKSLNPISNYKLGISKDNLLKSTKWNIK